MNEEEKAIQRCNELIKPEHSNWIGISNQVAISILLNLIDKQNKEIEHQKEKRENQKNELAILNEKQKEFNKMLNTIKSYKGQFKRQEKEIDKQNKVIEETSRTIIKERGYKNIDEHPEWIENTKRFFFKKVENDERREKFFRKVEGDDNSTSK